MHGLHGAETQLAGVDFSLGSVVFCTVWCWLLQVVILDLIKAQEML